MAEEELSKDLQLKILKEKLEFANNQLEEKEKQLDHYKTLCKTLTDIINELTLRTPHNQPPPQQNLPRLVTSASTSSIPSLNITTPSHHQGLVHSASNSSVSSLTSFLNTSSSNNNPTSPSHATGIGVPINANSITPPGSKDKVRPPPGFEAKKQNSIKGRKVRSFHALSTADGENPFDIDDDNGMKGPLTNSTGSAFEPIWRRGSENTTESRRSDDPQWRKPNTGLTPLTIPTGSLLPHSHSAASTPTSSTEEFHSLLNETTGLSNSLPLSSSNNNNKNNNNNTANSKLKKSISQNSLSSWLPDSSSAKDRNNNNNFLKRSDGKEERDEFDDELPSPRTSGVVFSTPLRNSVSPSFSSSGASGTMSENNKKLAKLKKSQSMNSVYTVLEENRLDLKFPELDQLIGQIYPLSKYQQGCRFLQKKLDEKNATNTNIILTELYDHLVELLTDPFGNYLFSKLMEHCDASQRDKVVAKILPDILTIAFDMYGTQSLQKMMPFLTENQIESVIGALKLSSIQLIKHNKANYLIQYCLDHLPPKHNQWIYDSVTTCIEEIARDRVGCVIVKRCIDHANEEQKRRLAEEISTKVLALVQDPFGNYVVQHILDKYPQEPQSDRMINNLSGSVNELCVQKFSSNVVEKCLQVARPETKAVLLQEIIDSDMLPQLLNDRFANFVIQTALDVAAAEQRQLLVKNILPHLGRHYSPYTKRLQKKILQVQ